MYEGRLSGGCGERREMGRAGGRGLHVPRGPKEEGELRQRKYTKGRGTQEMMLDRTCLSGEV